MRRLLPLSSTRHIRQLSAGCYRRLLSGKQYRSGPNRSTPSSSGAASVRGNRLPALILGKLRSRLGTTVPESGVATAATASRAPGIRRSQTAVSPPVNSSSSSSSTPIHYSASTRSPSCSTRAKTQSIRNSARGKPRSNAASPSSGNVSNTPSRKRHRSTKPARSARATRGNRRRGRGRPAAALAIPADHAGRELPATS